MHKWRTLSTVVLHALGRTDTYQTGHLHGAKLGYTVYRCPTKKLQGINLQLQLPHSSCPITRTHALHFETSTQGLILATDNIKKIFRARGTAEKRQNQSIPAMRDSNGVRNESYVLFYTIHKHDTRRRYGLPGCPMHCLFDKSAAAPLSREEV